MDLIKNFKIEKRLFYNGRSILLGKVDGRIAALEIELPMTNKEYLACIINERHDLALKNDVYYTLQLTHSRNVKFNFKYLKAEEIASMGSGYQYTVEKYDEYMNSRVKESYNTSLTEDTLGYDRELKRVLVDNEFDMVTGPNSNPSSISGMVFVKDRSIRTIRDIPNYNILLRAKNIILNYCKNLGFDENRIAIYSDYSSHPIGFRICFCDIYTKSSQIESGLWPFFIDSAIHNLKIDSEYYKKDCYFVSPISKPQNDY